MGGNGAINKTINGGSTWTGQPSGTSDYLQSVFFTNDSIGYVVGFNLNIGYGTILKTTNGGTNWTIQISGTSNLLMSVYFTDSFTGYAVGESGRILKTINGGTLWTSQNSGISNRLLSVYFTDADTGYAVNDSSIIIKTTNGGGAPVGVNDHPPTSSSLNIYPNPSSDKITIEIVAKGHLSILNLNDKELITRQITEPKTILDISGLPSGVYLVKLVGEKGVKVGKIIKQ